MKLEIPERSFQWEMISGQIQITPMKMVMNLEIMKLSLKTDGIINRQNQTLYGSGKC